MSTEADQFNAELAAAMGMSLDEVQHLSPEHLRRDLLATVARHREVLQECWDEYGEVMPDPLYESVRQVLRIREWVAAREQT